MKKLLLLTALLVAATFSSCKYDDDDIWNSVHGLENRVAKLEELCKQMNTNISSLQTLVTALQNNDYVTGVTPVTQNGETIGYTITFTKSTPITIYHGQNGKDGANGTDGKDGHTPIIGVRQDADGVYYWTLDGEWLLDSSGNKIKAEGRDGQNGADGKDGVNGSDGKDGQDGKPGEDGKDGQDGQPGADGKDGITPQLKIESGCWFVSTDNGTTWTNLGKATGEDGKDGQDGVNGTDGKDGVDGDSFFQSVDTSNSDYVVFTLADGTTIKLPTWYAFEQLRTLCNQMNTNISSLQAIVEALQNNDYVKSVTPVMQDGKEIGYTITFSKSNPITIYHGQNGKDGVNGSDGKDGHTPIIGVRQDSDGIYYWTLDGEWLLDNTGNKIKAEGRDGQNGTDGKDGQDGVNGSDGKDGQDGKPGVDGKDGITPQLKIEEGYWFVSTDDGTTWTNLGKATGEDGKAGANGADGKDGDSMFKSVTQDDTNVYFTLTNDEIITIPKSPRLAISFTEGTSLTFDIDETKTVHYTITGGCSNNVVKAEMLNDDGKYTLYTATISATQGTIKIATTMPSVNRVIVSVSDGIHTIMAAIDVSLKASFDGKIISVATPGTLAKLIADYDKASITELTVIGNLNLSDIKTIKNLPNIAILDMGNVNLEENFSNDTFYGKTSLTTVRLPKTLKKINDRVFCRCKNLTSIDIPSGITSIGHAAFSGCTSLTSITIPNSVTSINGVAFSGCSNLKYTTIPNSVTSIGIGAFEGCSGECIINCNIPNSDKLDYTIFGNSQFTNITIGENVTTIGNYAFVNCPNLISVTIPNSVTVIGNYAFESCNSLTDIKLPDDITRISGCMFKGCESLTSVNIPDGVTLIGPSAFGGCNNLTSITIPGGVISIGNAAFYPCSSLANIYCKPAIPPTLDKDASFDRAITKIYVPAASVDAYKAATVWNKYTDKIVGYDF